MRTLFLLLALILISFAASSQTATVRGFVYDESSGEPIIFTNVYLQGTNFGAATDDNGLFVITQVPPGNYTLMVSYMGKDTISEPITLTAGQILNKKLFMSNASITMRVFNVTAEGQDDTTRTKTSVFTLTPKTISSIPSFGAPDLAQYLQVLPGVVFTGDQGGQLYIRGGAPIQNKVLLDGMVIYNPFHSIGLFSVFETDILRTADVYTGGFGAEYGGRISSVMDITTRDGNKTRYSGKVGVSPFGTNVLFEGPIKKQKPNSGSSSFLIAAKNSYLRESSKVLYNYIDTAGLPFNFMDVYGKLSLNANNGSKLNVFGFNFNDDVFYKDIATFDWKARGGGASFLVIPGNSPTLIEGIFAFSNYKINLDDESGEPKSSSINGFNIGLNFTYFAGKNEIKYGLEMLGFQTNFQFFNTVNRLIQQEENTTELGGYVKYKMSFGGDKKKSPTDTINKGVKFILEPSFRLHFYASLSEVSPEPRVALKWMVAKKLRIKAAGGLYSQNLISASSDRDVVNLFYGFLSGPDNLQKTFDGEEVNSRLQKAEHAILGFELGPFKNVSINIEFYYKNFSQLTNLNRNKVFEDNGDYWDKPDYLKKDFIIEKGDAEGFDVSVKYDKDRYYLWAVYSFGYVHRYDGYIEYAPHYDRRHNVNLVGTLKLGGLKQWEISARWNYGSGFPFTQTAGFYPYLTFTGGINTDVSTEEESLGIIYDQINLGRLPQYHRLDINVKRVFYLSELTTLEINAGATNVYNRKNIFYFDRITNTRVNQLPLMPSATITLKF